MHFIRQLNCWSLRCSWSIACRRCSNYIFILNLTPGFNGLGKDNYKMRREALKFWDLVRLILETLRYVNELGHHWLRYWLFTCSPSHYLNQCWLFVCLTLKNKLHYQNTQFSFNKIHMKMSVVQYHPFCPAANEIEHNDVTKMVDIQNLFFL